MVVEHTAHQHRPHLAYPQRVDQRRVKTMRRDRVEAAIEGSSCPIQGGSKTFVVR
jgi:hypothetical protein